MEDDFFHEYAGWELAPIEDLYPHYVRYMEKLQAFLQAYPNPLRPEMERNLAIHDPQLLDDLNREREQALRIKSPEEFQEWWPNLDVSARTTLCEHFSKGIDGIMGNTRSQTESMGVIGVLDKQEITGRPSDDSM